MKQLSQLTLAQAQRVRRAMASTNSKYLRIATGDNASFVLEGRTGAPIVVAIREMVRIAATVHPDPRYLEVEANGKIVRAYGIDNAEALVRAWEDAPVGLRFVMLDFDFSDAGIVVGRDRPPRNNDGRAECYWCGSPTRKLELATSTGNICDKCGR